MDLITSSVTRGSIERAGHRVFILRDAQFIDQALNDLSTNQDLEWEDTFGLVIVQGQR